MMRAATTAHRMPGARGYAVPGGVWVVSALMAGASVAGSLADDGWTSALTKTVRDTDSGARAAVSYFPEIVTGGEERFIDENGEEARLLWDGVKGVFEVEFIEASGLAPADTLLFVRGAITAVCPSVDADALSGVRVEHVEPGLYRVDAQCPAVDAEWWQ